MSKRSKKRKKVQSCRLHERDSIKFNHKQTRQTKRAEEDSRDDKTAGKINIKRELKKG